MQRLTLQGGSVEKILDEHWIPAILEQVIISFYLIATMVVAINRIKKSYQGNPLFTQQVNSITAVYSKLKFCASKPAIQREWDQRYENSTNRVDHLNLRVNLASDVSLSFRMSRRTNEHYFIMTLNRYSLFLQEILLLLPVRLYSVLRQKLHELKRLFDFYQNLINFTAFDLWEREREKRKLVVIKQLGLTQK